MIKISNLAFSYTKQPFIRDIEFSVERGEIFGFLGPSGAGKSTIQKILIGMIQNYSGSVIVDKTQVKEHDNSFYENIGVDFEYPSLYEKMTARQNLDFFASLYKNEKYSTDELLSCVGLLRDKVGDKKVSEYSKGMKSRLSFIKALIHKPKILFLDEPMSGLDPANSRVMKDLILQQKSRGTTIIITTHNMEDATELCDRVAFIVDGKIAALDTPHHLIMRNNVKKVSYSYIENGEEIKAFSNLDHTDTDEKLQRLILDNRLLTIHSDEPSLGDIFMDITGRRLS